MKEYCGICKYWEAEEGCGDPDNIGEGFCKKRNEKMRHDMGCSLFEEEEAR